ncbi:MAG: DUF262 domain-containing protein [Blautia sp.]|nr:DUF262 domain-containing protein [Blautia sp.]MCM1202279.1 DUF262 domain-containing protein [Bacteroides fragilis]
MKSYIKTRTVQSVVRDIKKGKIILETGIQRKQDQWDRKKKSLLILSAIQGIIIPGIFAKEITKEKNDYAWEILDGKQRLTVLNSFLNNKFRLDKSYPEEYAAKTFSELDEEVQNTIKNTELTINIYQEISEQETEDIFCRLNNGQQLSNDNLYRAHMGAELRDFVDEAISKPFMEKVNFTRGQLRKSEDQGMVLAALALISDESVNDFSKKSIIQFIDDFKQRFDQELCDKILASLDMLDEAVPEKNKNLKKVSLPMIIANAALCLDDSRKQKTYAKNLNAFLDDYENREEYLELCKTSTASGQNVSKRNAYFYEMTK